MQGVKPRASQDFTSSFRIAGWLRLDRPLQVIWSCRTSLLKQDHLEQVAHDHVQLAFAHIGYELEPCFCKGVHSGVEQIPQVGSNEQTASVSHVTALVLAERQGY